MRTVVLVVRGHPVVMESGPHLFGVLLSSGEAPRLLANTSVLELVFQLHSFENSHCAFPRKTPELKDKRF